jgi:putative exporter of polyketide antibiotics
MESPPIPRSVQGFLVELLAGAVNFNHWLLDTSIFHQLALAPSEAPDWVSGSVILAVGVVTAVAGALLFALRDLVVGD